jgi:hypothetical protein
MQEEIRKHARLLLKAVRHPTLPHAHRLKEVLLEILIIVFAVSLSIGLHSWREHAREQEEVRTFLANVEEDLANDLAIVSQEKERIRAATEHHKRRLKEADLAPPGGIYLITERLNDGNYEGFKSSGRLGLIENEPLKQAILDYYQHGVPQFHEMHAIYNRYVLQLLDRGIAQAETSRPDQLQDPGTRANLRILIFLAENLIRAYDQQLAPANKNLIELIEKELERS